MIKKPEIEKLVEQFEYYICTGNGSRYEFRWKSKVLQYLTCGTEGVEIECLELIPESLEIKPFSSSGGIITVIGLHKFNEINPDEQLDLNCNSHGLTFANGKFIVTNQFVDKILHEEFDLATEEDIRNQNFDVIIFRNDLNEPVHSCKFRYNLFIHKEGIRKFQILQNVEDILKIEDYKNTTPTYYRRKSKSCPGICMNAVGEKPANSATLYDYD